MSDKTITINYTADQWEFLYQILMDELERRQTKIAKLKKLIKKVHTND